MSTLKNFPEYSGTITKYLPAVLKENKSGWIIEYYCEHPVTQILTRKQIKLQRIVSRYKSVKDARAHVSRMVMALNAKLSGGWNPFFSAEDARLYEKFSTVTDLFLKEKKKEKRENTYRSYESFCKMLNEWIKVNSPDLLCSMFSQLFAVRYMEYMYNERNVNPNTYNNHIKMGRALFNWMKERCYTKQNPFEAVKVKEKIEKTRIIIPRDVRIKIIQDLQVNNPQLLLLCKLVYNSLIRPSEIKLLRIESVNLEKRYIFIDKKIAKNKKSRFAAINQDIIDSFLAMNLEQYPASYFIFAEDLNPAPMGVKNGYYSKRWDKLRKRIDLPMEMQLYSLRDTGIHEMLKSGIDDLSVMQHADHSSLEMTTLYGNHFDPNLNTLIYEKSPVF
ncbi:MAG: tyrosine-type recombinase/integrase [Paludibacter sp.]